MGCCSSSASYPAVGPTQSALPKDAKICIVGAGPAGVHMAAQLTKRGFTNVVILEKTDRLGGKSYTPRDRNGFLHEMGTCYTTEIYGPIFALFEEYLGSTGQVNVVSGDNMRMVFRTHDDLRPLRGQEDGQEFLEWVMAETERVVAESCCCCGTLPCGWCSGLAFVQAVKRYSKEFERIFGNVDSFEYGLPPRPSNAKDIDGTFEEWLRRHGCEALIPLFVFTTTVQGYGYIETCPALYGLWWNTPRLLRTIVTPEGISASQVYMTTHGFENLWRAMAERHALDVRYSCEVTRISRSGGAQATGASGPGPVSITYTQSGGEARTENYDVLLVACPFPQILPAFIDLSEDERSVLSGFTHATIATTLYEAAQVEHENVIELWPKGLRPETDGLLYAHRNARLVFEPDSEKVNPETRVAYQYTEAHPAPDLLPTLLENLTTVGESEVKVLEHRPWFYASRWNQEQINAGAPWRLLELQGQRNTFFIGGTACFESTLDVVQYNDNFILPHFS